MCQQMDWLAIGLLQYSFNGVSNYILVQNSLLPYSPTSASFAFWFNSSDNDACFISDRGAGINYFKYGIMISANQVQTNSYSSNCNNYPGASSNYTSDVWNHVVVVKEFSTQTEKLYINSILVSSTNTLCYKNSDNSTYFGVRGGGSMDAYYKGNLDDIGIWNRALTANEITALYQGCAKPAVTPITAAIKTGENVTFTTPANANATFQWQTNPANVGWQNLSDNSTYSGTTTNALTLTNGQAHNNGQSFRVTANATGCNETSEPVTITINDVCTNYTTVTDLLVINVGTLSTNTPNYKSTITIYPNPAKEQITIDCGTLANVTEYQIKIVNTLGQEVYKTSLNQQQFTIPLNSWTGKWLYFVSLYDNNNVLITTRKIELQ